jgi:ABC-type Fe3+/spermidine/putrescine transport system ATPase subunit
MRFEIRQLQRKLGITSIYVTHDQQEAMVVADRIALMQNGRIVQVDTPSTIYNTPATLFAAKFIGSANVVPGVVTASGPQTRVKLKNGPEISGNSTGLAVGDDVHVIFRPEQVRVYHPTPDGFIANRMDGTVRGNVFLGNVSDLVLSVGGLEIRSQMSPPVPWETGITVSIGIPPEAVRILAVATAAA